MNTNIRTMRRLRHTHARFAALGLASALPGGPGQDEFDSQGAMGGMGPPPLPLPPLGMPSAPAMDGLLAMPELREEEDAVVGENEVDDRPWGGEVGIGESTRRRRRKGKGRAGAAPHPVDTLDVKKEEEEEEPPEIEVGSVNADQCMRWMGSKVLEHAGFQGAFHFIALPFFFAIFSSCAFSAPAEYIHPRDTNPR